MYQRMMNTAGMLSNDAGESNESMITVDYSAESEDQKDLKKVPSDLNYIDTEALDDDLNDSDQNKSQNASSGRNFLAPVIIILITAFGIIMAVVPNIENSLAEDDANISNIDSGDTSWMMVSAILVFFMTPGLAFFYGGMVDHKNAISTLMQSFICIGVVTVIWVIVGFSLAFGESLGGVIGNPSSYFLFVNVNLAPNDTFSPTIPFALYSLFQLTFAIITPALITGALAERFNFSAWLFIIPLWILLVYCPLCHMTWHPDGLLNKWGVLDFAGGTVVHMSSGFAALTGSHLLGKRLEIVTGSTGNAPLVVLGTSILWVGWFGFNGGSALSSGPSTVQALLTSHVAGGVSMVVWVLIDYARGLKISTISACCGAVVGLVVVTPAAGYISVGSSILFGVIGALGCSMAMNQMKHTKEVDDTLDTFACHGVGGALGIFLTACFAQKQLAGENGLVYGGQDLMYKHAAVLFAVPIYVMSLTSFIFHFVDLFISLRVNVVDEKLGLDEAVHGESTPLLRMSRQMSREFSQEFDCETHRLSTNLKN